MAWVRLDDQFFFHPKVLEVSNGACLLYLIALTQSNAQLTDGRVTPSRLRLCAVTRNLGDPLALAAELVAAGLWEKTRGSWRIHDYTDYQPTAEALRRRREIDAQRQAANRERARRSGENGPVSPNGLRSESIGPVPNPVPNPVKERPPLTPPAHAVGETHGDVCVIDDEPARKERPRDLARRADREGYVQWARALNARRKDLEAAEDAQRAPVAYVAPYAAAPGQYAHPLVFGKWAKPGEVRHEENQRWEYDDAAPGWRRLE